MLTQPAPGQRYLALIQLTWPNTLSSCLQTLKPYVCLYLSLHLCSWSIWRGKLWGYGNVKWRKCDGWQWYDFNDCVPSNIFVYTRNTSRIVRIVSVLGYQAFSGLRWQCLDEAPCLTVVNISLIGVTMPRVCWLLSRTIYDTCGSCGCVMTMSPGDSVADTSGHQRTCWQWERVTSGLIGPVIIYYPTLTVGILHKASEATAPSTPRLQGPSSVLWWEDTPETVSKVREGLCAGPEEEEGA